MHCSVIVDSLFTDAPIVVVLCNVHVSLCTVLLLLIHCLQMLLLWWFCVMSMFRCEVLCVLSTFAKIVMGKIGWLLYFDFLPDIFSMFSCVFVTVP